MDPFAEAFANIGADFEALMPTVPVTVREVDPDTGATVTAVENVPAMKRPRKRRPFGTGGGEVPDDSCRFVCRYDTLGLVPNHRFRVEEQGGQVWVVTDAEIIAFEELVALNVVRLRE